MLSVELLVRALFYVQKHFCMINSLLDMAGLVILSWDFCFRRLVVIFYKKVCLMFLSRILAKQTTYSSSTPFLEPVCKNLPTVYLLFFLDTIFFCKKTRLFFGTEIGHNRLWPIRQIIWICIEFSVCLVLSCW